MLLFLKPLRLLFRGIAALILLFEEWGWEPLARQLAKLGRLRVFRQLEGWIQGLPPYPALLLFFLPGLILMPFKILALYWLGSGKVIAGVTAVVLAKITGTAAAARLFMLTQPALMRLGWFATVYTRFKTWKDSLMQWVRESRWYRSTRALLLRMRRAIRAMWRPEKAA